MRSCNDLKNGSKEFVFNGTQQFIIKFSPKYIPLKLVLTGSGMGFKEWVPNGY